jgi:glyceraldehyde-3-phosphate dehydrogenase (NADP+) (phosphorylating)
MASFSTTQTNLKAEFRGSVAGLKRAKTLKASSIHTCTEAKVKVAINGFGRIGA